MALGKRRRSEEENEIEDNYILENIDVNIKKNIFLTHLYIRPPRGSLQELGE